MRNVSEEGALLEVAHPEWLPTRFRLIVEALGIDGDCEIRAPDGCCRRRPLHGPDRQLAMAPEGQRNHHLALTLSRPRSVSGVLPPRAVAAPLVPELPLQRSRCFGVSPQFAQRQKPAKEKISASGHMPMATADVHSAKVR